MSLRAIPSTGALIVAMLGARALPAGDCNQNGVPDALDTAERFLYGPPLTDKVLVKLEAVDLDGDGDADLAAVSPSSRVVVTFSNDGAGSFSDGAMIQTSGAALDVKASDLDGDGDVDLVFPDQRDDTAVVVLNDGRGAFASGVPFPTGKAPSALAVADLDGDHDGDLLIANRIDANLSVLFNRGNGAFDASRDVPMETELISTVAGDLDGDGDIDAVALLGGGQETVTVLLNDGSGALSPAGNVHTRHVGAFHMALLDLDSDGDLDVAVTNLDSASISLLFNDAKAIFAGEDSLEFSDFPTVFTTGGDVDGDGVLDLVSADSYRGVVVMRGAGKGKFEELVRYRGPGLAAALGDFDGDGAVDLAGGGLDSRVLFNDGTGRFGGVAWMETDGRLSDVAAADLDGDGRIDLVAADRSSSSVEIRHGRDPTFGQPVHVAAGSAPRFVRIADLDLDGKPDLIVLNGAPENLWVLRNLGLRAYGAKIKIHFDANGPLAVKDFDGDQYPDVTAVAEFGVGLAWNTGHWALEPARVLPVGSNPVAIADGDFDANGLIDIVTANSLETGGIQGASISILLNGGGRSFLAARNFAVDARPIAIATGDIDVDGKLDVVTVHSTSTRASLLFESGDGGFERTSSVECGKLPGAMLLEDLDGDGHRDLAVTARLSECVTSFRNDRRGGFSPPEVVSVNPEPSALVAADVDGDSDLELVTVADRSSLVCVVNLNRPARSHDSDGDSIPDECETARFHRGDSNGDGRLDLADAVKVLDYLFRGGAPPSCVESADSQNDGVIDLSDPIEILHYLFLGGPPPAAPGVPAEACDFDPDPLGSPRNLGCDRYAGC